MNNEKKKIHFNIVDLLIIFAVLALIAALVIRFDLLGRVSSTELEEVTMVYQIEGVRRTSAEAIQIGDVFTWDVNGMAVGKLVSMEMLPYYVTVVKEDGTIEQAEDEQRCVLRGTLKSEGAMTEQGFLLGGTQFVSAGKTLYVKGPRIAVSMMIMAISETA